MTVTAVNARDVALKNTAIRVVGVSTNYISLTCPTQQFKYGSDNQPQPVAAVVTATLAGYLQGTVTFTYSGFITAPTISGNQLSINPDNFTGDVATVNASLNYQGVNYQAVPITISKIFNQLVAKTTRTIDLLPAYTDGTGYTLPAADNYLELYNGISKVTTGVAYSPGSQTKNGVTVAVNTSTGLITVSEATPNAWTSNSENFTLTATRNLIAYTTTYTITKAKQGTGGAQLAEIALYQWATTQPATPTGTSTYTWLSKSHAYIGTDTWKETVPTSPGGVGIKLWQITVAILAQSSLSTTTYVVNSTSWAGGTVRQITTEANALIKTYTAIVYQNALSGAPTIAGATTYSWITNTMAAEPGNWTFAPPAAQTGYTLYQAAVSIIAAQTDTVTAVNWVSASITPVRYYGTDGASARRAYILVPSAVTPASTPATVSTTGNSTYPTSGTWFTTNSNGITWTVTWLANAPNSISEGYTLYQSDGVFVTNGNTSWGFPYISSLKVGNLAAISVNTGGLTISDYIKGGNATSLTTGNGFYVDSSGYIRVGTPGAAQLKFDASGLKISDSTGTDIFTVVSTASTNATTALQTAGSVTWLGDDAVQIITGTQLKKISGNNLAWDSQRYSAESYVNGAYITFIPVSTANDFMIGLNADPTTNSSYSTLDFAWYCTVAGTLEIYENNTGQSFDAGIPAQTYNSSTVLGIVYDGKTVKYYKDGTVIRTVTKSANIRLYADSSFCTLNAEAKSIRFGPVGAAGTDGITPTIAVGTITTGGAGSSASVTPTTSGTNTTLNFTIPQGYKGDNGVSYSLLASQQVIRKLANGTFSIPYVTGYIKKSDGTTVSDYNGYFKIYNDSTGLVYTSAAAESNKTYNFSSVPATMAVDIYAYVDSGFTQLIGRISIPVIKDGADSIVPGDAGARGSLQGYGSKYGITTDSWNNNLANRVIFNLVNGSAATSEVTFTSYNQIGDTVTFTNSAQTASFTKFWDGTTWLDPAVIINGNLIATGTIAANRLAANSLLVGHRIENTAGTFVMNFGATPSISISV